jgi:ABC-type Fe3+-hydroxamate transport system substrate-binding protein
VFSQLDAVQEGRVVIIDNMYFERPTGRLTELIKKISDDISSLNVTVPDETSFDE